MGVEGLFREHPMSPPPETCLVQMSCPRSRWKPRQSKTQNRVLTTEAAPSPPHAPCEVPPENPLRHQRGDQGFPSSLVTGNNETVPKRHERTPGESTAFCSTEINTLGGILPTFARSHLLALIEFSTWPPPLSYCRKLLCAGRPSPCSFVYSVSADWFVGGEAQCMLLSGMLNNAVNRKTTGSL